ncbi:hypothetical protein [Nocardioides sp.]|uniref:hypothetical protein n=1 Tax=Nocardioides sp. TaxID=35761 RepID=UPI002F412053
MPTALSSTDADTSYAAPGRLASARRAVVDVAILFEFRRQAVRRRHLSRVLSLVFVAITLGAAVVPAFMPGAHGAGRAFDILLLTPTLMAGILILNMGSAIGSGGGRELISRDQAGPHPISPTTDHLGALLLAPLNIAWMIQAWVLLGAVSYSVIPGRLVQAEVTMVLWIVMGTALGQVIAWTVEAVRRGPGGIAVSRGTLVAVALGAGVIQLTGHTTRLLDRLPTVWFLAGGTSSPLSWRLWETVLVLLTGIVAALVAGAVPAHVAARRMARDEARMETDQHAPRPMPRSVLGILVRTDRASVWRSVPMRRGVLVLAVGPGLVALFGDLKWAQMTILPGLVASGGALLFGVNAWCLDGRGALWRENLPAPATTLFDARTLVLAEFLGIAALITILVGALRAGVPNPQELAALVATLVVVTLQVVGAALRWSLLHPYPVDLRSARATPAPPAAMVGYSARLATSTTFTGLVFSGCAHVPDWRLSLIVAMPCLLWSATRLVRTRHRWEDPVTRARVVSTVAA